MGHWWWRWGRMRPLNLSTHLGLHKRWVLGKSREPLFELARLSIPHIATEESATLYRESIKAYSCSLGSIQEVHNDSTFNEDSKSKIKVSTRASQIRDCNSNTCLHSAEDKSNGTAADFTFLIENLEKIEGLLVDSDLMMLEKEILIQIERLGALKLFHACLLKTLAATDTIDVGASSIPQSEDGFSETMRSYSSGYVAVQSGKKKERKERRTRRMAKPDVSQSLTLSSRIDKSRISILSIRSADSLKSRRRRLEIAKKESDMTSGVQEISKLENVRINLEEKLGHRVSLSGWAEAVGVDEKTLKDRLYFGWQCRDKLLKSTRSLVIYLAKGYQGRGISFDDLVQAGRLGVLQGAERFDPTRGYRFSTYAQYWIRKCLSTFVARNSRGIQLPASLNILVTKTQKARRALHRKHGRYPCDNEIAKVTGLPLSSVLLARKCSRIPGSIDQKIGEHLHAKFLEVTVDTFVKTPEEMVVKQHMIDEIHEVLGTLHQRERQVLILRYGLNDGRYKSLEEIGRLLNVTKEWIRRIEQSAFTKLKEEEIQGRLSPFLRLYR
ncbi:RNA polymerase sigma factor [Nymphaea thermarum]|nr:RNA polymerase sigma factor [Nymphaea thermarum]